MNGNDDMDGSVRPPDGTVTAAPVGEFRNPMDALIVSSVRRLMDDRSIGIDDEFFDIGGNSIVAVRLGQVLREELGIRRIVRIILEHPVLSDLSDVLTDLLSDAS